jgi:hypothetical protein
VVLSPERREEEEKNKNSGVDGAGLADQSWRPLLLYDQESE